MTWISSPRPRQQGEKMLDKETKTKEQSKSGEGSSIKPEAEREDKSDGKRAGKAHLPSALRMACPPPCAHSTSSSSSSDEPPPTPLAAAELAASRSATAAGRAGDTRRATTSPGHGRADAGARTTPSL